MIERTHLARRGARLVACLALLLQPLAAPLAAQEEEQESAITGFSIPSTRSARARFERARGHVLAKRWNEAIEDLQVLLEQHGEELIRDGESGDPVHRGVADVATLELRAMPPEALALYRRRFEEKADAALDLARSRGDRQAVLTVARRWPVCEAAPRAWWTVGDLELELGNLAEARAAWARALRLRLLEAALPAELELRAPSGEVAEDWTRSVAALEQVGAALSEGERARAELAVETLRAESPLSEAAELRSAPRGSLRSPGPGEAPLGAPGESASAWPHPFRIPKPHPFDRSGDGNLYPVRVGDSVLLTNSLQLFNVNAYSGALRWESERPRGWERLTDREAREFFEGVDVREAMIAPAASERVAVAALQVPVTDITNETFRNIAITTIIPDRRLHAFDLESGAPLWDHAPPLGWDGESGDFTQRMSVAGPPVIQASRVLVPMHRMYGRVEFYVACIDLESGELLWSTQLVSGQRELNMFARAETEFSAPPVRVEGDRVIALTQLGAIAALDLFSGAILWETVYDQIPPPQRSNFSAQRMKNEWRNCAPVVADGVVVAAPFDSRELLGLDLESGELLWEVQHAWIEHLAGGRRSRVDVLVGADERTVYLGSWPVVALKATGGIALEAPRTLAWRFPDGEVAQDESASARPLLLADRMIVPWRSERVEVELYGGRRRSKPIPWQSGRAGNMLVDGGSLYTLDSSSLDGYFEWDMLLERAELAHSAAPGELEPALYLASLLAQRGRSEAEAGRSEAARDWLRDAGDLLEDFLLEGEPALALRTEMHQILRSRARVFTDLADGQRALRELRRAKEFAPDLPALRDTLVEEHELVRGQDASEQLDVLAQLEERCEPFALVTRATLDPDRVCGWRFVPLAAGEPGGFNTSDVEVPLWVTLERQELAAREERPADELVELQRLLQEWPERVIQSGTLGAWADERIARLIEYHGREIYAAFDAAADELLAQARGERDPELLALVAEYYPHSLAARSANEQLLTWASEEGDVAGVARYALAELPRQWAPERGTDRELQQLGHLGAALASAGNLEAARSLYLTLAAIAPDLASASPSDQGLSFSQLAEALGPAPLSEPAAAAKFDADALQESAVLGEHAFLGSIPRLEGGSSQAEEVLLFARERTDRGRSISIVAYSTDSVAEAAPRKAWETQIPRSEAPSSWRDAVRLVPGLVVAATTEDVYALDREAGGWRWTWRAHEGEVASIQAADGLIFVTTRRLPGTTDMLTALEATTGAELWSTEFERLLIDHRPACGDGRVVLLPRHSRSRGRVLDAFSGREVLAFELPESVLHASIAGAWIERGLLIVPWFLSGRNPARNRIVAVDLSSGATAWDLSFDEMLGGGRELRSILQHDGHTFLLMQPHGSMEQEGVNGLLVELHAGLGATARVGNLQLSREHRLVGIGQERRVELDQPFVYVRSFLDGGGPLRLQQLELPYGAVRWTQRLGVTREELYNSQMQVPATSERSVALIVSTKDGATRFGVPQANLFFLDTTSGQLQGSQRLDAKLGTSVDISLHGLGGALILAGKDLLEVLR
jgi:outer membrane protein assembly factor BamB